MDQLAEITVNYSTKVKSTDRAKIGNPRSAVNLVRDSWEEINIRESMKVLYLNRANKVLGIYELSKGGISSTVIDIRLLFATALKSLSCSVILLHNHPSGNLQPSQADINITNKINEAGKLLDILVLDHIILTEDSYFSFQEEGLI